MKRFYVFFVIVIGLLCFSCGKPKRSKRPVPSEAFIYKQAERDYRKGYWDEAYQKFKRIRDLYPGSPQSVVALLRMADIEFLQGNYEKSLVLYEEFQKFYPTNPASVYALFQIGNCYYRLHLSYDRDQTFTKKAILSYKRLIEEYPDNPYKMVIKKRISKLTELLAKHELYVAKFYFKMGYYRAAYHRLIYLLSNYPFTKTAKRAKKLVILYYKKALIATEKLQTGKKRDFWGAPVP